MSTPQKFRKLPVIVEAMQVPEGGQSQGNLMHWIRDHGGEVTAYDGLFRTYDEPLDDGSRYQWLSLAVDTLEGRVSAKVGDWIVRGVEGEFYPVRADIFAKTYEVVQR